MATEGVNITEDAEMAECEGDKVVTMMDVLQEQQEFEEDANAVLGASDDKNCTYAKGYIKRQAIYACLTCCPDVKTDPTKRAGVCLACSLMCHENHELVELYTKRNFRCDCGNPKLNSHPCQFTPSKPDLNDDNIYNQNFSGLYCICQRPYPDPEATVEDDMIQCIICEDWLHASHLDAVVPANDQYSEMICKACMEKNEFLHDYSSLAVNADSVDVDILTVNADKTAGNLCNGDVSTGMLTNGIGTSETVAIVANGSDVEMLGDKENSENKSNVEEEPDENDTFGDENKENMVELVREAKSDVSNSIAVEVQLDAERKEQETQSMDEKEISESGKVLGQCTEGTEEDKVKNILKGDDELANKADSDEKMIAEDVPTNETSSEPASETQEQKDEQSVDDADKDEVKKNNVETSETTDNYDVNKSEDQLLDDIRALTSDNTPDNEPKSPVTQNTAPSSENTTTVETKGEDVPVLDKEESSITDDNIDKTEDTSTGQQTKDNSVPSDISTIPETGNIEVPDTSQEKDVQMENTDDKTDSVMDAIDELLKGPMETNESGTNQTSEQPASTEDTEIPKANEVSESKDKDKENIPVITDSNENIDTDIEMTESASGVQTPSENKEESEKIINSETIKTSDIETTESTSKTEATENNIAESNLSTNDNEISATIDKEKEPNAEVTSENGAISETKGTKVVKDSINETSCDKNKMSDESEAKHENKRKLSIELTEETSPKKIKLDVKCIRPKEVKKIYKGATFWPSNFRQKLCTCGECISMYKDLHVLFLTDPDDTVSAYEKLGKENVDGGASQYEKGLQALSSLDRIQQINALTEYNKMRDKLLDFLKSFKDRKEIVKEEDIKAFFAGMKPRREPDGVYFCR